MPLIFGMPILESAQVRVQREVAVCLEGLAELGEQKLQSFHYQFPQVLLDPALAMPVVSIALGWVSGSCILKLYRRRIMSR